MKTLPLDVQLLKLGMAYAQGRAAKKAVSHLFVSSDLIKPVHESVYENLTFIHALVAETPPKILLKAPDFKETLDFDLQSGKLTGSKIEGRVEAMEIQRENDLSSLDLLNAVVPFTIADAICDLSYHRSHMADELEAFGQKGAENVEAFKNNWLKIYHQQGLAAYKLEDPFETNLKDCQVTLGFECIIKGHEGKGTDYISVNKDKLLTKIIAIRH